MLKSNFVLPCLNIINHIQNCKIQLFDSSDPNDDKISKEYAKASLTMQERINDVLTVVAKNIKVLFYIVIIYFCIFVFFNDFTLFEPCLMCIYLISLLGFD